MERTINYFRTHSGIRKTYFTHKASSQDGGETAYESQTANVSVNPNSIAWTLGAITFLLILANSVSLFVDYSTGYSSLIVHKLMKFFYVELELNAPAFFSTALLLAASALLALITVLKKKQKAQFVIEWTALSAGFLFMSFDEMASIHERLIEPMREILGERTLGAFYFAWVIPAIALVVCLSFLFLRFLWNLPGRTRLAFMIAATMYLGGAVGLEMIEGWYSEINGRETLIYMTLTTLEETLEMVGTIVFIWALLDYISKTFKQVDVRFDA